MHHLKNYYKFIVFHIQKSLLKPTCHGIHFGYGANKLYCCWFTIVFLLIYLSSLAEAFLISLISFWVLADDYRLFCGDLGNEVNDDVLSKAFSRFPSFNMARVSIYHIYLFSYFFIWNCLLSIKLFLRFLLRLLFEVHRDILCFLGRFVYNL